jgi:hypothetical protein
MKLNKIKTTLSLASLNILKKKYKFFTIEKNFNNSNKTNIAVSRTLNKVLAKNINLSEFIDFSLLKFPLTINFFIDLNDLLHHLRKNIELKNSNIVFINTEQVSLKENSLKKISYISPIDLSNKFNKILSPTILVLKCIQLSAANNTTKS